MSTHFFHRSLPAEPLQVIRNLQGKKPVLPSCGVHVLRDLCDLQLGWFDPVADAVADYLDRLKPTELQIPQVAWDVDATRWKERLFAREIADHLKRFGWKRTVKKRVDVLPTL